jgi:hypothetical protein
LGEGKASHAIRRTVRVPEPGAPVAPPVDPQYARRVTSWVAMVGLDTADYSTNAQKPAVLHAPAALHCSSGLHCGTLGNLLDDSDQRVAETVV